MSNKEALAISKGELTFNQTKNLDDFIKLLKKYDPYVYLGAGQFVTNEVLLKHIKEVKKIKNFSEFRLGLFIGSLISQGAQSPDFWYVWKEWDKD